MKRLPLLLFLSLSAYSQVAPEYTPSVAPPNTPITILSYRDGSNNVQYICKALSNQPDFAWTRSAATLTSIVDSSNTSTVTTSTAHGLSVGNRVTISGATVDPDLNGSYVIQSVPNSTTFTITTANVTDGTYNESTLTVDTTAPRSNASVWSIQQNYYTTTYLDRIAWAEGTTSFTKACDSKATYAYN